MLELNPFLGTGNHGNDNMHCCVKNCIRLVIIVIHISGTLVFFFLLKNIFLWEVMLKKKLFFKELRALGAFCHPYDAKKKIKK